MVEKYDPEKLAHRLVEAAIRNEDTLTKSIASLKETQVGFDRLMKNIPATVNERVDAILLHIVNTASTRITEKFTDVEIKAVELTNHYDRLLKDKFWTIVGLVTTCTFIALLLAGGAAFLVKFLVSRYFT